MVKAGWRKLSVGERELVRVKRVEAKAQARRTWSRVAFYAQQIPSGPIAEEVQESSSAEPAQQSLATRQSRIGRGQIDRFGVDKKTTTEETEHVDLTFLTGPASGLPPPRPNPLSNPPLSRATPLRSESAIWQGIIQEEGRFEWCRTNKLGNEEWLSAIEVQPREWLITKSRTTHGPE